MSRRSAFLSEPIHRYLSGLTPEPEVLVELRAETAPLKGAQMQIGVEQGRFMTWLVQVLGVRQAIEIGVFTGYSSICTALGMPQDGRLVACDRNADWTGVAQKYWQKAGVESRIELRLGDAVETLDALCQTEAGRFDFAFVDADKEAYRAYYEGCLQLLRPGGVIVFDNALWDGLVAEPSASDADTVALRKLNEFVLGDPRVSASLVPIGDGLLLVTKS